MIYNIAATYQNKLYNLIINRNCMSEAIKAVENILPNCSIHINQELRYITK